MIRRDPPEETFVGVLAPLRDGVAGVVDFDGDEGREGERLAVLLGELTGKRVRVTVRDLTPHPDDCTCGPTLKSIDAHVPGCPSYKPPPKCRHCGVEMRGHLLSQALPCLARSDDGLCESTEARP